MGIPALTYGNDRCVLSKKDVNKIEDVKMQILSYVLGSFKKE